jgi:penicillin-insensitive murein endopeptidase
MPRESREESISSLQLPPKGGHPKRGAVLALKRRGFVIDFEAISQHLYQLDLAAKRHGVAIWRVILAPELQIHLHHTTRWSYLSKQVQFSKKRSWVRHDEHYHVDFLVPCE